MVSVKMIAKQLQNECFVNAVLTSGMHIHVGGFFVVCCMQPSFEISIGATFDCFYFCNSFRYGFDFDRRLRVGSDTGIVLVYRIKYGVRALASHQLCAGSLLIQ